MLEILRNKHLLLDTNVLISAGKHVELWDDLFKFLLREFEVEFLIDWSVKFEFLRSSRTREDSLKKGELLDLFVGEDRYELNIDASVIEDAIKLSNLYARKNPHLTKQVSFTDCLLAAQAKKFCSQKGENQLFILSMDLFDFPLCVFDRIKVFTMDADSEVLNIGLFSFNQEKYKKLRRAFERI